MTRTGVFTKSVAGSLCEVLWSSVQHQVICITFENLHFTTFLLTPYIKVLDTKY